jgi:ABC-type branched-subunit amino acid transport system substrate-binding protein
MVLHEPVNRYVFNVRATYQREAERAVRHLSLIGVERIAVLHVDDSFGTDALQGVQRGFTGVGKKPIVLERFDRAKPNFAPLVQSVVKADAQAVMLIGTAVAVSTGTKALRDAGSKAQVVTLSNNASGGFIKLLGDNARGTIVSQIFPYERSLAAPIVKEASDLARAHGNGEVSPSMLEGFASAKVLVEGLRRAGPGPTRAKLLTALEGMRKFDLGGLEVSYGPNDHTGLDYADLSIIGPDGKFRR